MKAAGDEDETEYFSTADHGGNETPGWKVWIQDGVQLSFFPPWARRISLGDQTL